MNSGYSDSSKERSDIMAEVIIVFYIILLTVIVIKKK